MAFCVFCPLFVVLCPLILFLLDIFRFGFPLSYKLLFSSIFTAMVAIFISDLVLLCRLFLFSCILLTNHLITVIFLSSDHFASKSLLSLLSGRSSFCCDERVSNLVLFPVFSLIFCTSVNNSSLLLLPFFSSLPLISLQTSLFCYFLPRPFCVCVCVGRGVIMFVLSVLVIFFAFFNSLLTRTLLWCRLFISRLIVLFISLSVCSIFFVISFIGFLFWCPDLLLFIFVFFWVFSLHICFFPFRLFIFRFCLTCLYLCFTLFISSFSSLFLLIFRITFAFRLSFFLCPFVLFSFLIAYFSFLSCFPLYLTYFISLLFYFFLSLYLFFLSLLPICLSSLFHFRMRSSFSPLVS